jgi:hypothetical protein
LNDQVTNRGVRLARIPALHDSDANNLSGIPFDFAVPYHLSPPKEAFQIQFLLISDYLRARKPNSYW